MCIIADLKAGDEKALKSVFDEYRHAVYNYVFDKTKSVYCSKEVVQLTFIKLWNYRHNLKEHVDISYQLFRIARTTMIDELRKVQSSHYVENLCGANAQTEDPEEAIFYNDTRNKLMKKENYYLHCNGKFYTLTVRICFQVQPLIKFLMHRKQLYGRQNWMIRMQATHMSYCLI